MALYPVEVKEQDGDSLGWAVYSSVTHHIESHFVFETEEEAQRYVEFSESRRDELCDETDRAWEKAEP